MLSKPLCSASATRTSRVQPGSNEADPLYGLSWIKQAEGKSFPEHCGGQRTPTAHHHMSCWRFKGREGLALRAVSCVPEGTPAPGAGGVTPAESSRALAVGESSARSRGSRASAPGPAPHAALPRLPKSLSHPPPPSINFYNLLILHSVLKSKQLGGRNADSFS